MELRKQQDDSRQRKHGRGETDPYRQDDRPKQTRRFQQQSPVLQREFPASESWKVAKCGEEHSQQSTCRWDNKNDENNGGYEPQPEAFAFRGIHFDA
jgi:hypothetical protein